MAIEWKKVDKNKPPEGKFILFFDGDIYTGWVIESEGRGLLVDEDDYPLWETSEKPVKTCANVRYYAEFNAPV